MLTTLGLTYNNIGDAGDAALCLLRKRNTNLELWLATLPWPLGGIDSLCKKVEKLVAKLEEKQEGNGKKPKKHEQKKNQHDTKKELRRFLSTHDMDEQFGGLTEYVPPARYYLPPTTNIRTTRD